MYANLTGADQPACRALTWPLALRDQSCLAGRGSAALSRKSNTDIFSPQEGCTILRSEQRLGLMPLAFILDLWKERSTCREKCRGSACSGDYTITEQGTAAANVIWKQVLPHSLHQRSKGIVLPQPSSHLVHLPNPKQAAWPTFSTLETCSPAGVEGKELWILPVAVPTDDTCHNMNKLLRVCIWGAFWRRNTRKSVFSTSPNAIPACVCGGKKIGGLVGDLF